MSQQIINVGTANNDGTGDPLRTAMIKIQNNFSEIYGTFVTPGSIYVGSNSISVVANSSGFSNTSDGLLISSANSIFNLNDRVYYSVPTGNTPILPLTGNAYYYISFSNTTAIKLSNTYSGANLDITDTRQDVSFTGTLTSGCTWITSISSNSGIVVGKTLSSNVTSGIQALSNVASVNATTVVMTLTAGASGSANVTQSYGTGELHSITYADRTNVISNTGILLSSNSTVNSTANSTVIRIANSTYSANLTSGGLNVGANVTINATAVRVGNSTIYSNIASSSSFTGAVTVSNSFSVSGSATIGNHVFGSASLELNNNGSGDRNALIDFHSDDTYTDYSFRIIAASGSNGVRNITTRGTGNFNLATTEAAPIVFSANNVEAARITAGGNVGIGNTGPNAKLQVTGTANISGAVALGDALTVSGNLVVGNSTTNSVFGYNATNQTMAEFAGNANGFNYILVRNANTGTQSSADIAVYNDSWTGTADKWVDLGITSSNYSNANWTVAPSNGAYLYTGNTSLSIGANGSNYVNFFTGGTLAANERIRIDAGGNTGIGNTAPNAKLQVTGTANISGAVVLSNILTVSGNSSLTGVLTTNSTSVNTSVSTSLASGVFVANSTGAAISTNTLTLGTSSVAANGYTRLPNGLLMQWGSVSASVNNTTTNVFSFPTAFTNFYSASVTLLNATSVATTNPGVSATITANSTTQLTWRTTSTAAAASSTMYWWAIGN